MNEADDLARRCAEALWADDRASRGLGMVLDSVGAGRAVMSMRVRPDMVNGHGLCHGGFIFALAHSAMAFASERAWQAERSRSTTASSMSAQDGRERAGGGGGGKVPVGTLGHL